MSKILITGTTDFVGSNLLWQLIGGGDEIHILNRRTSNFWRIADLMGRVKNHEIDLLEGKKLSEVIQGIQPDYIFHLANAGVYGGVSSSDADLVKVNLLGLVNLLEALEHIPYQGFINVGSSSEYGLKDGPMRESDICEPVNVYGITKLAATCYASYWGRVKQKPVLTFRLFSPYGPFDDHRRLISRAILESLAGHDLALANPNAVRDYIFIDDVIDLFLEAKDMATAHAGEGFNVGTGKEHAIRDVVDAIARAMKTNAKIEWGKAAAHAGEPPKWEADMTKTFAAFTWRPRHSLETGLGEAIRWFRENQTRYDQFLRQQP